MKKLDYIKRQGVFPKAHVSSRTVLHIEEPVIIQDYVFITVPNLYMGANSHINAGSKLMGRGDVYIGGNVAITYDVKIITSTDTPEGRYMSDCCDEAERVIKVGDVHIKDNVYIGTAAIIMPGVTIGENSVIGAGCYIDKHVGPDLVVIPKQELLIRRREKNGT